MNKKGLIKSIIAAVFAIAMYVALAFNFYAISTTSGNTSTSKSFSLGDWFELLKGESDKLWCYNLARVFMIITLIVVAVAVILAFVNVFVDNKIVKLCYKITSIVSLVVSIVFLVAFVAGGFILSDSTTIGKLTISTVFLPHVGPIMLGICAIVASAVALWGARNTKKAK